MSRGLIAVFEGLVIVLVIMSIFYLVSMSRKTPSSDGFNRRSSSDVGEVIKTPLDADTAFRAALSYAQTANVAIENLNANGKSFTASESAGLSHWGLWMFLRVVPNAAGSVVYIDAKAKVMSSNLTLRAPLAKFAGGVRAAITSLELDTTPSVTDTVAIKSQQSNLADSLQKLVDLRNQGVLSDPEFEVAKQRLLQG